MDHDTWKRTVHERLRALAHDIRTFGPGALYGALCGTALFPVIQASAQGDAALIGVVQLLSVLGVNLLAGEVLKWRDRTEAELVAEIEQRAAQEPALRSQLDKVLQASEAPCVVQAILAEADRDWFVATLAAELKQMGSGLMIRNDGTLILAAGDRSVAAGGSITDNWIVPGDNNVLTYIVQHYQNQGGKADEETLRRQIVEYLKWVADRYGSIEMRGIKSEGQQVVRLDLDTVFVPLEATVPGAQARTVPLTQVLSLGERLVITGGPGCGKTTVLQHIAWTLAQAIGTGNAELAQEKLGLKVRQPADATDGTTSAIDGAATAAVPLPVLLPLSTYAQLRKAFEQTRDPKERTLAAFVSYYLLERQAGLDLPPDFFVRMLRSGRQVILLLDGLDEVPDEGERAAVREAVEGLLDGRDQIRVAVTCRTAAYRDRSTLGRGFREIRVQPLDDAHVAALVQQAYACVYRHDKARREEKIGELLAGITRLEEERRERMGEDAVRLIDSPLMVRMLLVVHLSERRLPQHRAELFQRATDTMLWPEHTVDEDVARRIGRLVGGSHEVHRELVQHLAFAMHRRGQAQGREIDEDTVKSVLNETSQFAQYVQDFVHLTRLRGTVMEERQGMYRFIHLAFQEFLTARYLAEVMRGEGGTAAIVRYLADGLVLDSWWREPILLTAGYLSMNSLPNARRFLLELANANAVGRAASKDADVQLSAAALAAMAALEWLPTDMELRRTLSGRLTDLLQKPSTVSSRLEVARSLSRIGDPRLGLGVRDGVPEFDWVPVPGGSFTMGGDGKYDGRPVHRVQVPGFRISRYPVTNEQYAAFVAATGQVAPQHWKGNKPPAELRNHPVVSVSWHDAVRFCRWVSKVGSEPVTLPSEAEWEKAARGDKDRRDYPWGDEEPDENRCNFDRNIGSATPVGIYPAGASPYGCLDMSGNVWEWTRSVYRDYPYLANDGRDDGRATGRRVLRGGAFHGLRYSVRCAFRLDWLPDSRYLYLGFRVVSPGL